MKKTVFFCASSSYIHTMLAARYMTANCDYPVEIIETNVNVPLEKNMERLLSLNPDIVAFPCYIFNITYVEKVIDELKKALPEAVVIIGGYEVAFHTEKYVNAVDYIIRGEGDFSFGALIDKLQKNDFSSPRIIESGTVKNLDSIKSPYTDEYLSLGKENRIIYMETCRGCPFACSYCMSANTRGVRSFSLERVFSDLLKVKRFSPPLVKFVDRTFNYDRKRARSIFTFLIENFNEGKTRFHFEVEPELFDEETFDLLKTAPKGLFQFEVGIQSYNKDTLNAVNRRANFEVIDKNMKSLCRLENVHVHADLIAGLPKEDFSSFKESFDRLFSFFPSCLQLGFLKVLRGSVIYGEDYAYEVNDFPPYEIISSPWMSKEELLYLHKIERFLDVFYNSSRFTRSVKFLVPRYFSPFEFFAKLNEFAESKNIEIKKIAALKQCDFLYDFALNALDEEAQKELERLIYEDFIASGNVRPWHKWLKKDRKI